MSDLSIDVLVDMQFGSTGKGRVAAYLAKRGFYDSSMRVQSIQAGHTLYVDGKKYVMRTVPCAWVDARTKLYIGPGAFIEEELLKSEIDLLEKAGYSIRDRLFIDYRTTLVNESDSSNEQDMVSRVGSTGEGSGSSLCRKIMRDDSVIRAEDIDTEKIFGVKTVDAISEVHGIGGKCLVEGAQGTLLSVHTSPYYPFVTSRECTVAGIMSETGLPVTKIEDIFGVMRTYPIRVGGNSGPTGGLELSWEDIGKRRGAPVSPEITSVTGRQRRIFNFSTEDALHSIEVNDPSLLCVTFMDYINYKDYGVTSESDLSSVSRSWIDTREKSLGRKMDIIFTGEKEHHVIDRR